MNRDIANVKQAVAQVKEQLEKLESGEEFVQKLQVLHLFHFL
jgi:hypothetical protein